MSEEDRRWAAVLPVLPECASLPENTVWQAMPCREGADCSAGRCAGGVPVALSEKDFQSLELPAGEWVVQPPGGYVLIGMRTNVYATSTAPVILNTSVLGQPVRVRATPVAWVWDFGDGARVGPVGTPGAPAPQVVHVHRYEKPGEFTITMRTTYRGEYSVAGGRAQPVEGRAEVASPGVTVTALTATNRLQAGD